MAGRYSGEGRLQKGQNTLNHDRYVVHLLVQLDIVHYFQGEGKITKQNVHAEKTYDAEIAEHAIQRANAVLSYDFASGTISTRTIAKMRIEIG